MATVRFNAKAIENRIRINLRQIVNQAGIMLQSELSKILNQHGSGRFYARHARARALSSNPKSIGNEFQIAKAAGFIGELTRGQVESLLTPAKRKRVKFEGDRILGLRSAAGVHQASAPGEPPAPDTGHLQQIYIDDSRLNEPNPRVRVGTNLKYGAWLEYGTRKIAMRPWLKPTYMKMRRPIQQMFTPQALLRGVVNASITVKPL